jgi:hypothetical protein
MCSAPRHDKHVMHASSLVPNSRADLLCTHILISKLAMHCLLVSLRPMHSQSKYQTCCECILNATKLAMQALLLIPNDECVHE